jgi:hypothetical protein
MLRRLGLRGAAVLILFSAPRSEIFAEQPGPINTERPSFSSSPLALPKGYWQLETSYSYVRGGGSSGSREQAIPTALLRHGFATDLELQLNWAGYIRARDHGADIDGIGDASLGVKWQTNSADNRFVAGLFAGVSLPVGDSELTSDAYDPNVALFWSFADHLDWFGTVNLSESGGRYQVQNGVGVSLPLRGNASGFLEYQGSYLEGEGSQHQLNTGVLWLHGYDLQFDIHGSAGISSRAPDLVLGAGISYRF